MRLKILTVLLFFQAGTLFAGGFGFSGVGELSQTDSKAELAAGLNADFQPDGIPLIFEGQVFFKDQFFYGDFSDAGIVKSIFGGVEFIAAEINLFKALNFFYGPELMAGYDFCNQKVIVSNAIYAGFNGFFIPQVQFFLQAGWQPEILIGRGKVDFKLACFPVRAGFRLWTN